MSQFNYGLKITKTSHLWQCFILRCIKGKKSNLVFAYWNQNQKWRHLQYYFLSVRPAFIPLKKKKAAGVDGDGYCLSVCICMLPAYLLRNISVIHVTDRSACHDVWFWCSLMQNTFSPHSLANPVIVWAGNSLVQGMGWGGGGRHKWFTATWQQPHPPYSLHESLGQRSRLSFNFVYSGLIGWPRGGMGQNPSA